MHNMTTLHKAQYCLRLRGVMLSQQQESIVYTVKVFEVFSSEHDIRN